MNQLGKNLALALCLVVTLLAILGVKRKFGGDDNAALLSQPAESTEGTPQVPSKGVPQPRVLQAKPVAQHDQAIASPTTARYGDSDTESTPDSGYRISPVPMAVPSSRPSARTLDAPELVPVASSTAAPEARRVNDEALEATTVTETPTFPVASRPMPEFVLTGEDDSFWSISKQVYGSGAYYRALFRHNESKVLRPDQLSPGIQVSTPPLEVLRERYPADFPTGASSAP
jgi:nucleoid-associated protein YgaU